MSDFVVEEFLKGALPQIVPLLSSLTDAQLVEVRESENASENSRSTLITAIDRNQSRRDQLAEEKKAEAKKQADRSAQKAGFADAQAQEDAKKAAANQPKRKKAPKAAKPMSAKVLPDGIELAKDLLDSGELTIGFGDDRNLNVDIPRTPANLRMFNGQLVTLDKVVMRTSDLRRITTVTYAYLLHEKKVLAVREMGAPIRTEPNQQIVFNAGSLSFR